MTGATLDHRDALVLSECTWQAKRAVLTKRWKYIRCWDEGIYRRSEVELYDVMVDPDEQRNVAARHPEVVADLAEHLDSWLTTRLKGRQDPLVEVVHAGLPAVRRLEQVLWDEPPSPRPATLYSGAPLELMPQEPEASLSAPVSGAVRQR
jgi:hypothetical protein